MTFVLPSALRRFFPLMGIIDRYLFAHIVLGSAVVVIILAALDTFFAFLGELDSVGKGNYDYIQLFLYLLYNLPTRIYNYAPTAVLLGGLVSLGGLASRGELVAIRAAGKSISGIVFSVLKAGLVLALLTFFLGEWVAPAGEQVAEKMRSRALSSETAVNIGGQLWVRDGDRFIHAKSVLDDRRLMGVTVYGFNQLELKEIVFAASAKQTQDGGWLLEGVSRLQLSEGGVERVEVASERWQTLVDATLFEVLNVKPREMSARSLNIYISYLQENELDSEKYELAYWNRFMTPFSTLVMLMLALPFVFGSQRSGGAGQQVFIGIMLGIGYFLVSKLLNQLGLVYGLPPFLSAIFPPLLFGLLGAVLLRRVV